MSTPRNPSALPRRGIGRRAGFTLVELVIVIVVLGILASVALPRFVDISGDAKDSADKAAIAGISSALTITHLRHRVNASPSSEWIDEVADIAAVMHQGVLPEGITIAGAKLQDQRGNTYTLTAESATEAAKLTMDAGGGGGGGGGGGS